MLNSYQKRTLFYLVYSPLQQCAHNELELELELESRLYVSGFEPEHLSPSFTTMNKLGLVSCEGSRYLSSLSSAPGYLTKAVVRGERVGGGGEGCKSSCNLGGQTWNLLPFTKKLKTKFSES